MMNDNDKQAFEQLAMDVLGEPDALTLAEYRDGLLDDEQSESIKWQLEHSPELRAQLAALDDLPSVPEDQRRQIRSIAEKAIGRVCPPIIQTLLEVLAAPVLRFPEPAAMAAAAATASQMHGRSDDGTWEWEVLEDEETGDWILAIETKHADLVKACGDLFVRAGDVRKKLVLEYDDVVEKWGGELVFTHEEAVAFRQHADRIILEPGEMPL
jgi:hypothetical protein